MGFDVAAQNIFSAQTNLQSKMGAILQRITKMASISCSSGQVPSVQVGILAMDSNGQAAQLDFTDNADVLFEAFKGLRSRGPYVLNAKTISAYTDRFKTRNENVVKVGNSTCFYLILITMQFHVMSQLALPPSYLASLGLIK